MWHLCTFDCVCNTGCNIDEYLDIKNALCEKSLIGKLVLECEDEILNANETSLDYQKITSKKNYLIHAISLAIICLLLFAVVSIGCYYYYTRNWIKKRTRSIILI